MTSTMNGQVQRKRGRPTIKPDPNGTILNRKDVSALTGVPIKTIDNWQSTAKGRVAPYDPPCPPYDNTGSAVWLRSTIVPWLRLHRLVPPGTV